MQQKRFIQRNMVTKQLNAAQLNVLSLMAYIDTEQEQQELHDILLQFYRKKTAGWWRQEFAAPAEPGCRYSPQGPNEVPTSGLVPPQM